MFPRLTDTALWLPVALLVTQAVGSSIVAPSASAPVVDLAYARYQGVPNAKGNIDFLGIRYAAPPIGNGRFGKPQAPANVNGIQLANTQPNQCFQGPEGSSMENPLRGNSPSFNATETEATVPPLIPGVPLESEDCLFLNVVVPGNKVIPSAKLPVVVWIHGGGYITGSASYPGFGPATASYDGNDLVTLSDGKAIVVSVQYRLGVFGFLAGEDVKKGGALNAGLLDQQFALTWVQRHISNFGGDPRRVAIWGESAGAGSVIQHLVANGGKTSPSLFQTVISSSSFLPPQYGYNERIPEAMYAEVVRLAGCNSSTKKLQCLQALNSSRIVQINAGMGASALFGTFAWLPVVDGTFIQERPLSALRKGKTNTKNVLAITNSWEGSIFAPSPALLAPMGIKGIADYVAALFPNLSQEQLSTAARVYSGLGSVADQVVLVVGESIFICPTYSMLRSLNGRAYKGEFAVPPASHGADVGFYFPSVTAPAFNNSEFTNTFAGTFLDFALNQTPYANRSGSLLPSRWSPWSEGSSKEVVFNRTGDVPAIAISETSPALLQRCLFWDSVGQAVAQ